MIRFYRRSRKGFLLSVAPARLQPCNDLPSWPWLLSLCARGESAAQSCGQIALRLLLWIVHSRRLYHVCGPGHATRGALAVQQLSIQRAVRLDDSAEGHRKQFIPFAIRACTMHSLILGLPKRGGKATNHLHLSHVGGQGMRQWDSGNRAASRSGSGRDGGAFNGAKDTEKPTQQLWMKGTIHPRANRI